MDDTKPKDGSTFNFEHKKRTLIAYMQTKIEEGDWHAVSDAANDLRVLDAANGPSKKFLVQSGIEFKRTELNGEQIIEVSRGR